MIPITCLCRPSPVHRYTPRPIQYVHISSMAFPCRISPCVWHTGYTGQSGTGSSLTWDGQRQSPEHSAQASRSTGTLVLILLPDQRPVASFACAEGMETGPEQAHLEMTDRDGLVVCRQGAPPCVLAPRRGVRVRTVLWPRRGSSGAMSLVLAMPAVMSRDGSRVLEGH